MKYIIEKFDHEEGLSLKWDRKEDGSRTEISFEYGDVVITETIPQENITAKNGNVIVPIRLTRNQIKNIIDIYASLYEPRIVGWSN